MLKQLPSRNQRTKGFKVKDALQISVLLIICIWLLYQANKIYHDKITSESSGGIMANEVENGLKLGRKGLNPLLEEELVAAFQKRDGDGDDDEEEEDLEEEGKVKAKEANADDEMDVQKTEEEEPELLDDLIDEDDGEKEEASKVATNT